MINRKQFLLRIPFDKYRPEFAVRNGLGIEAAFSDSEIFYQKPEYVDKFKPIMRLGPVPLVAHLPFIGLDIASQDRWVRTQSLDIVREGLQIAIELGIHRAVLHLAILPEHTAYTQNKCLSAFEDSLSELLPIAKSNNVELLIENTWEKTPLLFEKLFEHVESEHLKMCLDVAHLHCFSDTTFNGWWHAMKDKIRHIHLSDNDFTQDKHLVLGMGKIDFPTILSALSQKPDLTYTLEINPQEAHKAVEYLHKNNLISN